MTTDDSLLSAWLADDLDDDEAASVEARLATDPALARRLDAIAGAVAGLRRLDAVSAPTGLEDRVRERVSAELTRRPPPGTGEDPDPSGAVALDTARQRRAQRGRWTRPLSVAAAVVLVSVVGVTALSRVTGGGLGGGEDSAGSSAAVQEAPEGASGGAETSGTAPVGPVIVEGPLPPPEESTAGRAAAAPVPDAESDSSAESGSESAEESEEESGGDGGGGSADDAAPAPPEQGLLDVPEAQPLLGLGLEQAAALEQEYRAAIASAPAFSTGVRPDACLDTVTAQATGPLVPVRAQATTVDGAPALAYVLVGASQGSSVLDRVEVWVTDPQTCATRQFLQR